MLYLNHNKTEREEKKMTDNEIIELLERMITVYPNRILDEILDLINRQKAEIERLQKNIDGLNIFTTNHMKVIRLQAIKEFAERLKYFIIPQKADGYTREIVLKRDIDNLVKEMTEVEE